MQTNPGSRSTGPFSVQNVAPGEALRLGRSQGLLRVLQGRLWLTRRDDPDDHLVAAGERIELAAGADAVIEAYDGAAAMVEFVPRHRNGLGGAFFGTAVRAAVAAGGFLSAAAANLARRPDPSL